jgi:hypothetical protein
MSANRKSTRTRVGVVILILGCGIGVPAFGFSGGTGEPNNPYQIATPADLVAIGSDSNLLDKHLVLVNDIDLDPNLPGGRVFTDALIAGGNSTKPGAFAVAIFIGVLDGRGHTIHHLCISGKHDSATGLFGIFEGLVKDLHLEDVRISGSSCGAFAGDGSGGTLLRCSVTGKVAGSNFVGGLMGAASNLTLFHCESRADVVGDTNSVAGGLVGSTGSSGQVMECRAAGTVTGGDSAGGLIGRSDGAIILRCAAVCQVTADQIAGGLIGHGPGDGSVADCYARGSVASAVVGGLIGNLDNSGANDSRILSSYAACDMLAPPGSAESPVGSGLFGKEQWPWQPSIIIGCFWDKELPKVPLMAGPYPANYGTGLTTQQMQQQETFKRAGWDLGYAWAMPEGGYPVLRWELAEDGRQR